MVKVEVASEKRDFVRKLGETVIERQGAALARLGTFRIAISGGSLVQTLYDALVADPEISKQVQWDRWHVYFCDERCVALDDKDSNYGAFRSAVLDKLGEGPRPQVYAIDADLVKTAMDGKGYKAVAKAYESVLPAEIDLVLLGCGPDGHTCSLFPGDRHKYLLEYNESLLVDWCRDSPKPPPNRITFTLPMLNKCRALVFVAEGASKQDVFHDIFDNKNLQLPTALINQMFADRVTWLVNKEAFAKVETKSF